jgi:hypothetical protein
MTTWLSITTQTQTHKLKWRRNNVEGWQLVVKLMQGVIVCTRERVEHRFNMIKNTCLFPIAVQSHQLWGLVSCRRWQHLNNDDYGWLLAKLGRHGRGARSWRALALGQVQAMERKSRLRQRKGLSPRANESFQTFSNFTWFWFKQISIEFK